jgi:3-oxoacyl-[acyl-carrier-protein] synthase II
MVALSKQPKGIRRVVITGLGVFTSIGKNALQFQRSLEEGRGGIEEVTLFDVSKYPSKIAAQIRDYDPSDYFDRIELRRLSRTDQFALIASREAMRNAEIEVNGRAHPEVGVCLGAGAGGMLSAEQYHRHLLLKGRGNPRPSLLLPFLPSYSTDVVSRRFHLCGPKGTITTACSSSATAIGYSADLIRRGYAEVMICGGSDAMSELTFGGFNALRVVDQTPCKPFDARRMGMTLGEGAGILVMEELNRALARGATIFAEILGYSTVGEAHHMTAPEASGTEQSRTMREAMRAAHIGPDEVDYINAHGTGTPLNDSVETLAIKVALGEKAYSVPVSSIKSMVGHCLGSAGAVEAVASVLAIAHDFIPPTVNYRERDEACDLDYVPGRSREQRVETVLSNSFAFGGNCTTLVLRKYE